MSARPGAYPWPLLGRLHTWFDRHPFAGDRAIAAIAVVLAVGEVTSGRLVSVEPAVAPTTEEIVLSLALVAPLPFAPRAPVAVFALVAAACLVQLGLTDHVLVADLAPLVALYFVLVHGPSRLKPAALAVALAGGIAMSAISTFPGVLDGFLLGAVVVTVYVLLAALLADRRVNRRDRMAALEAEADRQAEIGAAQERARIARELHDVVAHSLAVMIAQADGGRYAAPTDPAAASRALTEIAGTGREALAQMGHLLGVLRAGEEHGDLPRLVHRLAAAGLPVELEVEGCERQLPEDVRLCLHRVAQEALTNVLKHASAPRRVDVVLRYLDAEVDLTVRDDGRGTASGERPGHGLAGMRERVALLHGTVRAGPVDGGGFEVRARLPAPAGEVVRLRA